MSNSGDGENRKVSFKRILVSALRGFKHATARLVFAAIFTVFALTFFGYLFAYGSMDWLSVELDRAYENGYKTVVLCGKSYSEKAAVVYFDELSFNITIKMDVFDQPLSARQLSVLESQTAIMPIVPRNDELMSISKHYANTSSAGGYAYEYVNVYYSEGDFIQRIVELGDTGEADACLEPDARLTGTCRLPHTFDEIAITDYFADMFVKFGYKDDDGQEHAINGPDDLIGKKINGLTVCGVYKTEENKEQFKTRYDKIFGADKSDTGSETVFKIYEFVGDYLQGEHIMRYAFVRSGFTAARTDLFGQNAAAQREVLYKLSGSKSKDKAVFASLKYTEKHTNESSTHFSADIKTRYAGFTRAARSSFLDRDGTSRYYSFMKICYDAVAVAATVGAVIFTSFLSGARKAEKGGCADGMSKGAHIAVAFIRSAIFALAAFVLSASIAGIVCASLNAKYRLPLFGMGAGGVFAVLGVSVAAAAVAAAIQSIIIAVRKK